MSCLFIPVILNIPDIPLSFLDIEWLKCSQLSNALNTPSLDSLVTKCRLNQILSHLVPSLVSQAAFHLISGSQVEPIREEDWIDFGDELASLIYKSLNLLLVDILDIFRPQSCNLVYDVNAIDDLGERGDHYVSIGLPHNSTNRSQEDTGSIVSVPTDKSEETLLDDTVAWQELHMELYVFTNTLDLFVGDLQ